MFSLAFLKENGVIRPEYLQWYISPCEACELQKVLFNETSFKDNIMGSLKVKHEFLVYIQYSEVKGMYNIQ